MSKNTPVSRFYDTDPSDPDAPRRVSEYDGPHHGLVREGDLVVYENPAWRRPDGSYATGGMDGVYAVTEMVTFGGDHPPQAILDNGKWEVSAANLRPVGHQDGGSGDE